MTDTKTTPGTQKAEKKKPQNVIRIFSAVDGFRRCGMAHPKRIVDHPEGTFTPTQIKQLKADPNLTVSNEKA